MARYSVNGRKIREIRLTKGIGSKDLAKKAGISERTLLEIEEGRRQATEETFFAVCKALKIDAGECLADEAAPSGPAPAKGDANAAKATA
jgi:transcriptional regulator with XRE-family HTH domain